MTYGQLMTCAGKDKHASRFDAGLAVAHLVRPRPGYRIRVYRCQRCGYWHVGHSWDNNRRALLAGRKRRRRHDPETVTRRIPAGTPVQDLPHYLDDGVDPKGEPDQHDGPGVVDVRK